jgi:hypothetical protein
MKNHILLSVLVLMLGLQGCAPPEQVNTSCDSAMGEHSISYVGRMEGGGKLQLLEIPGGKMGALQAKLTLYVPTSDDPEVLIEMQGAGSCAVGVVRVTFSTGAGQNEEFGVAGGSLLGIFRPEMAPVPFGRWELNFVRMEGGNEYSAPAFWQVVEE